MAGGSVPDARAQQARSGMSNERSAEDEYIAREEVEKQHKLAKELSAKRAAGEAAAMKAAHWHKCPNCGNDLQELLFRGVRIDRCYHCHGTWLDAGEVEKLLGKDKQHKLLEAIVNVFTPSR
jgi:hypothetical protein